MTTTRVQMTAALVCAALLMAGELFAQAGGKPDTRSAGGWCGTPAIEARLAATRSSSDPAACVTEGNCDIASIRDQYLPGATPPVITVRLYIHVFRNDDGSNAAATASDVTAQMTTLNAAFAPAGIQFEYEWRFVNSTLYRNLSDAEEVGMKTLYAIKPDSQLNVYVVSLAAQGLLGYAYTPWQPNALQATGGCVVTDRQNGGFGSGAHTLTHEIGHNLGLHHTHRGVDEVTQCSGCYESPNLIDNDTRGDFCSDTRPTPTNFACGEPGGSSPCNGAAWSPTPFRNYMGYASDACYTNFSSQQMARMRCWTQDALSSWLAGVSFVADTLFGPAPLTVQFTGQTSKVVNQWSWTFGDGGTSTVQSPQHTYTTGGTHDVAVTIETATGDYESAAPDFISVYADTVDISEVSGAPLEKVRVDFNTTNAIPLQSIVLPFTWAGTFSLTLDSVRMTGLRTATYDLDTLASDPGSRRLVVQLTNPLGTIAAGTGSILSLWFRMPIITLPGSNPIVIQPIFLIDPEFTASAGSYQPVIYAGEVSFGCCENRAGNVNGDASDIVDIADLTFLVDHLFLSNQPLPCIEEANCSGDPAAQIDIDDLTTLVDHLFVSTAALPLCQ